jgi:hypothetical protein
MAKLGILVWSIIFILVVFDFWTVSKFNYLMAISLIIILLVLNELKEKYQQNNPNT